MRRGRWGTRGRWREKRKEKGKKERGRVYIGEREGVCKREGCGSLEAKSSYQLTVDSLYNAAVVLLCLIPSLSSVSLATRDNYFTCKPNSLSNRWIFSSMLHQSPHSEQTSSASEHNRIIARSNPGFNSQWLSFHVSLICLITSNMSKIWMAGETESW